MIKTIVDFALKNRFLDSGGGVPAVHVGRDLIQESTG